MKKAIAALLLLLFVLPEIQAQTTQLKILSWNIYMLPCHIRPSAKLERAKHIGEQLKDLDYDIIVFQEAFHGGARRKIRKAFGKNFPYRIGPANRNPWWFKTSSGIWILSKIPITQLGVIDFKECEGPDCWSHKGALLVEGEKEGKKFQVLGTHLEAGGPQTIRDGQYKEIGNMLSTYAKEGMPQFICGDFNTKNIDTTSYRLMLSSMQAADSLPVFPKADLINHVRGKSRGNYVIDYIFCRNNTCTIASVYREVKIFRGPVKKTGGELSDHFAIEAILKF